MSIPEIITTRTPRYRWSSPQDWLGDRINELYSVARGEAGFTRDAAIADLVNIANTIVNGTLNVDSDSVQDAFQDEMSDAGYFVDLDKPVPVLYELDERGEATGTVHFFCSDKCRDTFEVDGPVAKSVLTVGSPEVEDGTVCDECGNGVAS